MTSSTESFRDWIWPETWSILLLCAFCCVQHLLLQVVHVGRHLVDGVGALLDEVLHDAHALVVGLLEARDGILQLLDLGLQLDHVPVGGEGGRGEEHRGAEKGDRGETDRFVGDGELDLVDWPWATLGFLGMLSALVQ